MRKVSEGVYEFPKEKGMLVPARLYTSEKLLKDLEEGAIQQGRNVAYLPGIQKYSIMLPDSHYGYGFPIGGVAAFDEKEGGIICPGGIGYDINCTKPDTKVTLEHGTYIRIKDIEKNIKINVLHPDLKRFALKESNLFYYLEKKEDKELYKITTKTGKEIEVTADHPIYTKQGMVVAERLTKEDMVAVCSFKGVRYQEAGEEILATEEDIHRVISEKASLGGHALKQITNFLKKNNLLPLTTKSKAIPYLIKIMGFVLGDGSIVFPSKSKGTTWFYSDKGDLERIRHDIMKVGFKPSRVYERTRKHKIKTYYKEYEFTRTEYSFKVRSTGFAALLISLGCISGNKTAQEYRVPLWLFRSPLWQKRLFLAALFGAELSSPATVNKYNFYCPTLGMNKLEKLESNAVEFLTDIKKLLEAFNIATTGVAKVKQYGINGKAGKTTGFRIQILSAPENLLKFFETVSYEYNTKKFAKACLAANYIGLKEGVKAVRAKTRLLAVQRYANGVPISSIVEELESAHTPAQFLKHSVGTNHRNAPRVAFNFMSFQEYADGHSLGENGIAWDEIERIERVPYSGPVCDITVNDEDHNFIANGFVVSNCGVRMLSTNLTYNEVKPKLKELMEKLFQDVPSGVGSEGRLRNSQEQVDEVARDGALWAVEHGYGTKEDLERIEENGRIEGADPKKVSDRARKRGRPQLGTLGAGNHFLEIQRVDSIYDKDVAKRFGVNEKDQIIVMLHCGSRGYGYQICDDYIAILNNAMAKFKIDLPDRELVCAPLDSREAQDYVKAMYSAVNYAFCNRQVMTHWIRETFEKVFKKSRDELGLDLIYDVCHNIAKFEEHEVDGKNRLLCVHRKGATRAFPAGRKEIPKLYRDTGQPVLIPGDMGLASYILVGTEKASETFYSTAHGAGRCKSRTNALRNIRGEDVKRELEAKGQIVMATSHKVIAEEAPGVYKNVDEVIKATELSGISRKIARTVPMGVAKG